MFDFHNLSIGVFVSGYEYLTNLVSNSLSFITVWEILGEKTKQN